ncbi:MAG TPA: DUF5320 domain-containing protein [Firmicutes bacterium]|nr:DUF5320 domain-containing protein [Bacillota bacterium]
MPRGDGTGPRGFGPLTGRGAGYCAGYPVPGCVHPYPRGGWGYGRGYRWRYYATGVPAWVRGTPAPWGYGAPGYLEEPVEEKELLKHDVAMLEKQLKKMRARLKELEEQQQEDEE